MPRGRKSESPPEIYVARSSGVVKIDGQLHNYYAGTTRVRAGHPLIKAVPGGFVPLELDYDVEDASNTPGRKRGA